MDFRGDTLLAARFQETRRQLRKLWFKLWGGGCFLVLLGFAVAWIFVEPAPTRTISMAAGPEDGAYFLFASRYAEDLQRHGITLKIRRTAGSIENGQLLASEDVELAIMQGGTVPPAMVASNAIESLASLYLEPVWLFYRSQEPYSDLRALRGKKIAIGVPDSGTQSIAKTLLSENGIDVNDATRMLEIGGSEAVDQLNAGALDAALFVMSPQTPLVQELMSLETIRLLGFQRHAAYARRHTFLSDVTLRRGVVDLGKDLPAEDLDLIAPAANLVASPALHDALVPLLLKTVSRVHEQGDILVRNGRFPSTEFIEAPLNESARLYFEHGPPFLQKYLPFWVASAIDRGKILLLPALTLLLPLFKIAPPIYRWRIRSRIYKWYELLRQIEGDLVRGASPDILQDHRLTLTEMERELDELDSVPLPYMEEFYNLRLHLEFVERRLDRANHASSPSP